MEDSLSLTWKATLNTQPKQCKFLPHYCTETLPAWSIEWIQKRLLHHQDGDAQSCLAAIEIKLTSTWHLILPGFPNKISLLSSNALGRPTVRLCLQELRINPYSDNISVKLFFSSDKYIMMLQSSYCYAIVSVNSFFNIF